MYSIKVSICIPTYNGEKYLQEALDSINHQNFRDFEVVISDDASSDDTLKIVENFKNKVDFPVHIYEHKPCGIGANWNNSIRHANGEYIKFLFQDDVLEPICLEKMQKVLDENPKVGLVASKREFIIDKVNNEATQKWLSKYQDLQKNILENKKSQLITKKIFKHKDFINTPKNKIGEPSVVMFRRSLVDKIGVFDENLKQILDYEYWYRVLKKYHIYIINETLVKFRLHNMQATAINASVKITDYALYPKILYKDYFWLLNYQYQKEFFFKYNKLGRLIKKIKKRVL